MVARAAYDPIVGSMVRVVMLLLLSSFAGNAQKLVRKSLLDSQISLIEVDATNCYRINVRSSPSREMTVEASMEGEYANDLSLRVGAQGTTMEIGAGFAPQFNVPNDKLSAHKLLSIALNVTVPDGMDVRVHGTNSSVAVRGRFGEVTVVLADGQCLLDRMAGSATVSTLSGEITLISARARVEATSRYGQVIGTTLPIGQDSFLLHTVTGNIHIKTTP